MLRVSELRQMQPKDETDRSVTRQATVTRVDRDGVAWAKLDGADAETPCTADMACEAGDRVTVTIRSHRATVTGNASAPATDDTAANAAQSTASEAYDVATEATEDARRARAAADSAETSATAAQTAATAAQTSAGQAQSAAAAAQTQASAAATAAANAQSSADNANEYAARALSGLSTVESVAETLEWVTEHGTMTLTADTVLDPSHVYFVADEGGDYVVGGSGYSLVIEPSADDLATYYELSIDESLQNFVGTHLSVTDEGLWVLPATTGYKLLIATGQGSTYATAGTYIIDSSGVTVAKFTASQAVIGATSNQHAVIESEGMNLVKGNAKLGFESSYSSGLHYSGIVFGSGNTGGMDSNDDVTRGSYEHATGDTVLVGQDESDEICFVSRKTARSNGQTIVIGAYTPLRIVPERIFVKEPVSSTEPLSFIGDSRSSDPALMEPRAIQVGSWEDGARAYIDWDGFIYGKGIIHNAMTWGELKSHAMTWGALAGR